MCSSSLTGQYGTVYAEQSYSLPLRIRFNLIHYEIVLDLGPKFVFLISLTKKYIMGPYGNCTISYQTVATVSSP